MNVNIKLPLPHPKQREILASKSKRKVVCAGRRGGKTTMIASYSVQSFLNGRRVIYGTPVSKQLKDYWGLVKKYLKPLIKSGHIYKNETDKYLRWAHDDDDGPMISAQTAYDADTWRGGHGDVIIYDEYAFMHPSVWEVVGSPMLLDTGGEAWFISTPNRKNHFYANYMRGIDDQDARWQSFRFTSHDNPHLNEDALRELSEDMTEDNFKQEIMALFLDNAGAVFRNIDKAHIAPPTRPNEHKGHMIVAGIDWAKRHDYTVIDLICRDCNQEVSLTRFNKIDYIYQRDKITRIFKEWNVSSGLAELNSIGEPNLEMLIRDSRYDNAHILILYDVNDSMAYVFKNDRLVPDETYGPYNDVVDCSARVPYDVSICRYGKPYTVVNASDSSFVRRLWQEGEYKPGLPITGFNTTATSKPPLIENLVGVVERVEYQFLDEAIPKSEMESYEIKINPQTNRPTYSAPAGVHDDTVIARALAAWLANRYIPASL